MRVLEWSNLARVHYHPEDGIIARPTEQYHRVREGARDHLVFSISLACEEQFLRTATMMTGLEKFCGELAFLCGTGFTPSF